ncbi:MAG TPA: Dam family site-specific DNA-(adenine-N6)-methyltransferase [Pyrinomonadaceae bacterium]|nr:Dam family site-specific DNA-(adenine-N6)-methyltransferase [Pyrinomonadaceae bacterium]
MLEFARVLVLVNPQNGNSFRPPLKWAGGKRWQLPYLRKFWEPESQRRLVEPFCGGLAVALGLMPKRALLNDINPHVVNFYSWLQRGLKITIEMNYDASLFYRHRSRFNELLRSERAQSKEAASLFYYLNRTAYNGLCRFNRSGEFNVPFGRYTAINYKRDFTVYRAAFRNWKFANERFDRLKLRRDDFVYADPPYDVVFTQYAKGGFDWNDQVRTAQWLATHPGPVILSNQATQRIKELYRDLGYKLIELDAPRKISRTGDRTRVKEVLALRNLPA